MGVPRFSGLQTLNEWDAPSAAPTLFSAGNPPWLLAHAKFLRRAQPKLWQNSGVGIGCPWGVRMSYPKACLLLLVISSTAALAQISHSEQVQIAPPLVRAIDPPSANATAADLEHQADLLREDKMYLDALDYYEAALNKKPNDARLLNKIGITDLMMQHYKEARKSFERSIRANHEFADAYNNLGVVLYEGKKYGAAIKEYQQAITKDNDSASFYSNLGAAYFSKREFEPAVARLSACAGTRSRCVCALFARRSAGAIAQPRGSRPLRLHCGEALRQDGPLRTIT